MSDQEKKPREFWLGLNESVIYTKNDFVELPTKEDPGPFVHVIEHSAFDKLQKENEALNVVKMALLRTHESECKALQAQLAEAQAALEKVRTSWLNRGAKTDEMKAACLLVDDALAKLRGQDE